MKINVLLSILMALVLFTADTGVEPVHDSSYPFIHCSFNQEDIDRQGHNSCNVGNLGSEGEAMPANI